MKKALQHKKQQPRKRAAKPHITKLLSDINKAMFAPSPAQLAARAKATEFDSMGYKDTHHLMEIKQLPASLIELQKEITLPQHRDIYNAAFAEKTFELALGMLAAKVDILLDGSYDVPKLCELLVTALRTRRVAGANPSAMHPDLVPVDLVEKEDSLAVEFAGNYFNPDALPQPSMDGFSVWMREQGCDICESKEACKLAEKCLGKESLEEGVKLAEKSEEGYLQ